MAILRYSAFERGTAQVLIWELRLAGDFQSTPWLHRGTEERTDLKADEKLRNLGLPHCPGKEPLILLAKTLLITLDASAPAAATRGAREGKELKCLVAEEDEEEEEEAFLRREEVAMFLYMMPTTTMQNL